MDREISVTFSEEIVRASVRKQWLNLIGTSGFATLAVLIALFVYLVVSGDRGWFFGFGTALLLLFGGIIIFGYFRLLSFSMSKFRSMDTPTATFRFNDDGIAVSADTGRTEVAWKLVEKILQTKDVWVIIVAGGGLSLPTDRLDDDLRNFILQRSSNRK
jgi:hypothetical protein